MAGGGIISQSSLARIAVAYLVRNCKNKFACWRNYYIRKLSPELLLQVLLATAKTNWRLKELYHKARSNSCRNFLVTTAKNEVLARGSILESSIEFMLQALLEPRKQSTYCVRMLARIHVANFLRTATKNKKLLAGGIQSESSCSNCDVLLQLARKSCYNCKKHTMRWPEISESSRSNCCRNLRLELRKTNIAGWRNEIRIQKRKPRWKWCRNLVRNLENKLPAGNIRKLLIELMLRKFRLELRKQKIAGWTLEE